KLIQTPEIEIIRDKIHIPIEEYELTQGIENIPSMTGSEYITRELLELLWSKLNDFFSSAIQSYNGTVEEFIKEYSPNAHLVGRVFFHLVENKDEEYPFAFMATYSTEIDNKGKSKHLPLKYALEEYGKDHDKLLKLLSAVYLAAKDSNFIKELSDSGELFHGITWTSEEAFTFLKEVSIYENSGILCRIPNWWKGRSSRVSIKLQIGDKKPSVVGMNAILNFNARLVLGDVIISEEEARELLRKSEGLAFIKNKWVAVDPEKLKQTLSAYEKAKELMEQGGLSFKDALLLQLNPDKFLKGIGKEDDIEIVNGKWIESVTQKLVSPELITSIKPHEKFKGELRNYQQKGLNWIYFLYSLKFGACLADDMGLGKTVQILAFLSILNYEKSKKASLLIIPASLISNWEREIIRFFPELKYFIVHPYVNPSKKIEEQDEKTINSFDLFITTYSLAQKYEWLKSYSWNCIILDEAQAIKNPSTKQAKAVKKLESDHRIIMTGTPIENRLSDLWSLFDFLNPGLLGGTKEFTNFSKKLGENKQGYGRLRKVIRPYILRRLKTDKSIISDLPDKVEMKSYADLSKKQVLLYNEIVECLQDRIDNTEGIERKGLILSTLMKLKQLCNHPDQYNGTGNYEESESGKFIRLAEICETIYEKREKALIFTQFKEITEPLYEFLSKLFQRQGLILHGSIPVKKRKDIIEKFQSREYIPFMVLSLKAGGIGLNLTEANHVIHFDRWWNPAVENQATDRAFRIGQKKNVVVHKFIVKGTVEEKIDFMIEEKKELAKEVIAETGETFITEMKNDQIIKMFKLSL
ncbi:MAG: DEAD/DEAH box helicase, partial [Desulfobacterales bacterium]|nr:DEAD/DEAH box helicase [Desulfobacterales bacterium]